MNKKHSGPKIEISEEEAVAIFDSKVWEKWTDREIVQAQLFVQRLIVPFKRFHEALEKVLGRPVWTHEMGLNWDGLVAEFFGEQAPPTLKDILGLIPADRRYVLWTGDLEPTNAKAHP